MRAVVLVELDHVGHRHFEAGPPAFDLDLGASRCWPSCRSCARSPAPPDAACAWPSSRHGRSSGPAAPPACPRALPRRRRRPGPVHPGGLVLTARIPLGEVIERTPQRSPAIALVGQREQQQRCRSRCRPATAASHRPHTPGAGAGTRAEEILGLQRRVVRPARSPGRGSSPRCPGTARSAVAIDALVGALDRPSLCRSCPSRRCPDRRRR